MAAITNIIGNILLIPARGYVAAAYTTLFAYFVLMLLHYIVLNWILKKQIYKKGTFIIPILILLMLTVVSVFNYKNIALRWIIASALIFALCIVCTYKRKELIAYIKDIRK